MSQIKVEYVQHVGDSLTITNSARVSFGNSKTDLDDKDKKLIKYLADHQHMSPFEHCFLTVKITCPLYIRSQIHRHRTFSFNEISRRYTDKNLEFYMPEVLRTQSPSNRQASSGFMDSSVSETLKVEIEELHEKSLGLYEGLLAAGVCKEQARGVLAQNLLTEFYMSGNLRNWAHFVKLREHEGAQWEAQQIAKDCKQILIDKFGYGAEVLFGK